MPNAPSNVQAFTRLEKSYVGSGKEWESISKKVMSGVIGREKPLDEKAYRKVYMQASASSADKKNRTGYATLSYILDA